MSPFAILQWIFQFCNGLNFTVANQVACKMLFYVTYQFSLIWSISSSNQYALRYSNQFFDWMIYTLTFHILTAHGKLDSELIELILQEMHVILTIPDFLINSLYQQVEQRIRRIIHIDFSVTHFFQPIIIFFWTLYGSH